MKKFEIVSLNVSENRGGRKRPVDRAVFREGYGIEGDSHAGSSERQVSLLGMEDIEYMKSRLDSLGPGDFAENITTKGIELYSLPLGTKLSIGDVVLVVTRIGKDCPGGCSILDAVGECVMPERGVFANVLESGEVTVGTTGTYDI